MKHSILVEMPLHITNVHNFISEMALTALLVPRNRNVPEQPEGHSGFTLAVSIVDLRETYY